MIAQFVLALSLLAQVQNPTTVGPGSPQNQCVPTHKKDAASQTQGSPQQTIVDVTGNGSLPCPNNTAPNHKKHHSKHQHHRKRTTPASPSPAPQ